MEFDVDKIKENIDKAAVYTVKKTGEVISCAKLKLKKTELKGKISDAYKELGEAVYTGTKAEDDISEKVSFIIRKIDDLKEEFAECNEALDNLKEQ